MLRQKLSADQMSLCGGDVPHVGTSGSRRQITELVHACRARDVPAVRDVPSGAATRCRRLADHCVTSLLRSLTSGTLNGTETCYPRWSAPGRTRLPGGYAIE